MKVHLDTIPENLVSPLPTLESVKAAHEAKEGDKKESKKLKW